MNIAFKITTVKTEIHIILRGDKDLCVSGHGTLETARLTQYIHTRVEGRHNMLI